MRCITEYKVLLWHEIRAICSTNLIEIFLAKSIIFLHWHRKIEVWCCCRKPSRLQLVAVASIWCQTSRELNSQLKCKKFFQKKLQSEQGWWNIQTQFRSKTTRKLFRFWWNTHMPRSFTLRTSVAEGNMIKWGCGVINLN